MKKILYATDERRTARSAEERVYDQSGPFINHSIIFGSIYHSIFLDQDPTASYRSFFFHSASYIFPLVIGPHPEGAKPRPTMADSEEIETFWFKCGLFSCLLLLSIILFACSFAILDPIEYGIEINQNSRQLNREELRQGGRHLLGTYKEKIKEIHKNKGVLSWRKSIGIALRGQLRSSEQ